MKRLAAILFCLCALRASAFQLQENTSGVLFGDSWWRDGTSTAFQTGKMFPCFKIADDFSENPSFTNLMEFEASRSGGTLNDQANSAAIMAPAFYFNASIGIYTGTNFALMQGTQNGNEFSNAFYLHASNNMQFPLVMTNGTANTNEGGYTSNGVAWLGVSATPDNTSTGGGSADQSEFARQNALSNAISQWGQGMAMSFNALSNDIHADFVAAAGGHLFVTNTVSVPPGNNKAGHLLDALEWGWYWDYKRQTCGGDTNIANMTVSWTAGIVSSNHCAGTWSVSGNVMTIVRHNLRQPGGWDVPGLGADGLMYTNDCSYFYTTLDPSASNWFKFDFTFTNMPAGPFNILEDGVLIATNMNFATASNFNMFTLTTGPTWNQRMEILGRVRDIEYANRTNRVEGPGGDGIGFPGLLSLGSAQWPTHHGDDLLTNVNVSAGKSMQQAIWGLRTNSTRSFAAIRAAATITNHTYQIIQLPSATITASSTTTALNVPVILDGSASLLATNFTWSQIAGSPQLDFVGQGTAKPMIISVTNAGSYTFQLVVSDGTSYATNSIALTFTASTNHIIFVDNQLSANTATYSIASRNGSGTDGNGFTNIQNAVGTAVAGDTVFIRGGVYAPGASGPSVNQYIINPTNSGTVTAPIRIESYNGESVMLKGWGFSDADTNSDGIADGIISNAVYRQTLVFVPPGSDYIQIKGLDLTNSQGGGLTIEGNFCYVQEVNAHDCWTSGAGITKDQLVANGVSGDVFRWVEAYNNRHFTGILIGLASQQTFGYISNCAVVDCVSYWNGYTPAGTRVLPFGSDSEGGGNSGGFWTTKYFADNAVFFPTNGIRNYGLNLYFVRNLAWNNCDDGFAFDNAQSLVQDNRSLFNGPTGAQGYKMLRSLWNMTFNGNIAFGNQARGFEIRNDTNSAVQFYNNDAVRNAEYGVWGAGSDVSSNGTFYLTTNNVSAFNGSADWPNSKTPNWGADGFNVPSQYKGDPKFVSTNITFPVLIPGGFTNGFSVKAKRDYVDGLVTAALSPATNSPLLRAGVFIPNYNVPTADNDAVNPATNTAVGRHWLTNAPDMGALSLLSTNIAPPAPPPGIFRFGMYR